MDNLKHAKEWLKYAETDYDVAVHLSSHHPVPIEIICFHCQQAGEKALKAILAYYDKDIPRTHNLHSVLELCGVHYPEMTDAFSTQAKRLTDFAVIIRYPNEIEVTEADMVLALKSAEQILSYVSALW